MSEPKHQEKLAHISQNLLQLPLGSSQDTAFRRKASTTRLLAKLWGDGDHNAWWEEETDADGTCIFSGIQLDNVRALKSFVNRKQNILGPIAYKVVDILKTTAEEYDHFIGYWNGDAVNYDEGKATLSLQARKEHESECRPPFLQPSRQEE